MKIDVYRNLNKGGMSIRSRERHDRYGRVIDHADLVIINNAQFVVQPAGRAKVRYTHRKNVHAFVRGDLVLSATAATAPKTLELLGVYGVDKMTEVTYNPYNNKTFVVKEPPCGAFEQTPVYSAGKVVIFNNKIYADGLKLGVSSI